jgi:hypothetical protein
MTERFRRGSISIGAGECSGCGEAVKHGDVYLVLDEKPSDKVKDEVVFTADIDCSECGSSLENGDHYLLVLDGETEKIYCPACYKKKGGESFRKKNSGAHIAFKKTREESETLYFCMECCVKRKAGAEKKEKGEKVFSFFPSKGSK